MRTYSVPRRFGLATLLVATLAFSALSAVFRWLEWPATVVLGILGFIGIVSGAQFVFDRKPRLASAGAGGTCAILLWCVSLIFPGQPIDVMDMAGWLVIAMWIAFWGAIAGYVTGTMIGGMFLLMAAASAVFGNRPDDQQA